MAQQKGMHGPAQRGHRPPNHGGAPPHSTGLEGHPREAHSQEKEEE